MKPHSRLTVLIAVTFALSCVLIGCKSTTATLPNGAKVTDRRFLMRTEASFEAIPTNGAWSVRFDVKSDAQTEAIKAAASGAAEGVAKGLKP